MSTIFDLNNGDLFKWKDEVYALVRIECGNTATVRRYSRELQSFTREENFNPYAEIQPV